MPTTDNPAGRLVQVITDMDNNSPDQGQPFRRVLADAFDFPRDDGARVITTVGKLLQLTQDGKNLVESLDRIEKKLYLEPFQTVESALSNINLQTPWKNFRSQIDESTLKYLQFVSDIFSRSAGEVGEKVINEDSLAELLADVNTMLEKLLEAQLPQDLKEDLLDHLEDIRSAIIDYRLFGLESLKKTFDNNLGLILRRRDEMQEVGNSEGEGIFSDFAGLISKLGVIISAGTKFKELVEPIFNNPNLPGGDN